MRPCPRCYSTARLCQTTGCGPPSCIKSKYLPSVQVQNTTRARARHEAWHGDLRDREIDTSKHVRRVFLHSSQDYGTHMYCTLTTTQSGHERRSDDPILSSQPISTHDLPCRRAHLSAAQMRYPATPRRHPSPTITRRSADNADAPVPLKRQQQRRTTLTRRLPKMTDHPMTETQTKKNSKPSSSRKFEFW